MYLTVKQQVKHLSKEDYITIRELCHTAKNLANEAIYNVRQHYFTEGEFLKYEKNYTLLKNSPNDKALNSNQHNSHIGKQNNQNFVNIPYGQLRNKLEYLCKLNDIVFVKQEESYTSKSSFWDRDDLPVYNADNPKEYPFRGRRLHRGLYKTASGKTINADVNGALNIMRKSSVVDMNILYSRGEVDTPIRIRIA